MSCIRFEERIALYVEGDLPERERVAVERHVWECSVCAAFEASLRESQAMVRGLRDDPVDQVALAAIRARVMEQVARPAGLGWGWRVAVAGIAMALLFVAAMYRWPRVEPLSWAGPVGPPPPPAVEPVVRKAIVPRMATRIRRRYRPAPKSRPEPLVVKMLTDDPNVVIYWLVD